MVSIKLKKLIPFYNYNGITKSNRCKGIRLRFISYVGKYFSPDAPWLQKHISHCPRCQKRLASINRVNLALSLIKSQPHNLNLLMKANTQAINVLKHSLREAPKAQKLKKITPEPKFTFRLVNCLQSSLNIAACLLIVFLMKFGIFSSVENMQTQGKKAYKQYFVSNIGEDLTKDIFPTDFS